MPKRRGKRGGQKLRQQRSGTATATRAEAVTILYFPGRAPGGVERVNPGVPSLGALIVSRERGGPRPDYDHLALMPGINLNVPAAKWESAKQDALTRLYLRRGALQEIRPEGQPEGESLAGYALEDATRIVENEGRDARDTDRLRQWEAEAESSALVRAIQNRLQAIQEGDF